jgi:hypothetical protein
MAQGTRKLPGAVYYADPDKFGMSRHEECFKQAGIDPKKNGYRQIVIDSKEDGYPQVGRFCWPCSEIAAAHLNYKDTVDKLEEAVALGRLLLAASKEAFRLAWHVRCATGSGIVERKALEAEKRLAAPLRRHRSAWKEAGIAAELAKKTRVGYPFGFFGGGPENLDPCQHLAVDPTTTPIVDVTSLERPAGWLCKISRIMRRDELRVRHIMRESKDGEDQDAIALGLAAKYKVALPCLAREIGQYLAAKRLWGGWPTEEIQVHVFDDDLWRTPKELAKEGPRKAPRKSTRTETRTVERKLSSREKRQLDKLTLEEFDKVYGRWRTRLSRKRNKKAPTSEDAARDA